MDLHAEALTLAYRPLGPDDTDALHVIGAHWSVVRQLGSWPWPPDRAFTAARAQPFDGPGFVWGIVLADRLVGTVGMTRGEIGYMLHPDVHGRGIALRAARVAVAVAFADPGLCSIAASTWHDNPASGRVLARLGFVHWQTQYGPSRARGIPTLLHRYRLTRARWATLEARPEI